MPRRKREGEKGRDKVRTRSGSEDGEGLTPPGYAW